MVVWSMDGSMGRRTIGYCMVLYVAVRTYVEKETTMLRHSLWTLSQALLAKHHYPYTRVLLYGTSHTYQTTAQSTLV
mgnify:CR=1 FL=1